jgi:hypothetical protein
MKFNFGNGLISAVSASSEAQKVRDRLYAQAEEAVRQAEEFLSIIKTLNWGLIDPRLDTTNGTMTVIHELADYYRLTETSMIMLYNLRRNAQNLPEVYFNA